MDDMMGGLAATAFVLSGREILAVQLLNHFVKYRIPVGPDAQLATSPDGARLYVVDRDGPGGRIGWFHIAPGTIGGSIVEPSSRGGAGDVKATGSSRGAAVAAAGTLYLLKHAEVGLLVHRYDGIGLRELDRPAKNDGCGDRLLASDARFAVSCRAHGELHVFSNAPAGGGGLAKVPGTLVAEAMAPDGTIYAASAEGGVFRIRAGTRNVDAPWRIASFAPIVTDGLAWAAPNTVVVAQGGARPRLHVLDASANQPRTFDLPNVPANGILASGQFVYWVDVAGSGLYHIDITTGLVERMHGPLTQGSSLGAVSGP